MQDGNYNYQYAYVDSVLQANNNKSFVKRILERELYPTIKNSDGSHSTHKMAWGEVDGKYVMFPTILFNGKKLREYKPKEALKKAMKTNNFIEFDSPEKAEWFSKNYKLIWR